MKKFKVIVCRTSYQYNTVEVEAESKEAAEAKALAESGNHLYKEEDAEYEVNCSSEINPEPEPEIERELGLFYSGMASTPSSVCVRDKNTMEIIEEVKIKSVRGKDIREEYEQVRKDLTKKYNL